MYTAHKDFGKQAIVGTRVEERFVRKEKAAGLHAAVVGEQQIRRRQRQISADNHLLRSTAER